MSLHSRTWCLWGTLHFHLLCSPCSSCINTSDISQHVWMCIPTAVCTWETYPKCLQIILCTVFFTVLNSWLSHLRGFFWLLVKNFWPQSTHSCHTVGLSYFIPQMQNQLLIQYIPSYSHNCMHKNILYSSMYKLFVHEILQFMLRCTVMFKASAVLPSLFFQLLAKCNIKNMGHE